MHAIVVEQLGDASVLQWREVPDPMPGPGEVTIHVTVSGVNFADIMRRRGGYRGGPPPFTPGLDCAGTIVAVGDDVRGFHIGQRVCAFAREGSYAEIVVAKAVLTYPLPDGVPDEAGAALTMLVTAYNLLTMVSRMQRSESILVHAAAGGMGTMLLQMAKALGAGTKIGVAGGAEKVAIARNAGADVVIDHEREDVAARVRAVVGERGVDVIFDAVAGDMFAQSIPLLALFGRYGERETRHGHDRRPAHRRPRGLGILDGAVSGRAPGGAARRGSRCVGDGRCKAGERRHRRSLPAQGRRRSTSLRRVARLAR
jgi:NADPH2:quinone reductase